LERARKLELPHPPKDNVPKPQHDEPQHDGIQQDGSREKTAFKRRLKDREWLIVNSIKYIQEPNQGCYTLSTEERRPTKD